MSAAKNYRFSRGERAAMLARLDQIVGAHATLIANLEGVIPRGSDDGAVNEALVAITCAVWFLRSEVNGLDLACVEPAAVQEAH